MQDAQTQYAAVSPASKRQRQSEARIGAVKLLPFPMLAPRQSLLQISAMPTTIMDTQTGKMPDVSPPWLSDRTPCGPTIMPARVSHAAAWFIPSGLKMWREGRAGPTSYRVQLKDRGMQGWPL